MSRAFGDAPFDLPAGPDVIQVRGPDVLWQKERLLNIAVSRLPARARKVAWLDGDLLFADPDWAGETARLLDDEPEVFAQYWEAMAEHNVAAQLASIKVPATFIAGKTDRASSAETLQQMADAVPQGAFELIDGPHMLPLEQAAEFRAALDRHASRLTRSQ